MDSTPPSSHGHDAEREAQRLAALHSLELIGAAPEQAFDGLVALAARMLDCPIALLNLVDRDRLWVAAGTVAGPREISRDVAMCDRTIRGKGPLVIDDLAQDPVYRDSPLVVDAGYRFYAGTPLHLCDDAGVRQPIGTLCVIDSVCHRVSQAALDALAHLATLAEALLEGRRTALRAVDVAKEGERLLRDLARKDRIFRHVERIASIGSWHLSLADDRIHWSDNTYALHGLPLGQQPARDHTFDFYPPHDREEVRRTLQRALNDGAPFDIENDFVTARGHRRRVRSMGEAEIVDGRVTGVIGVFQDVTVRHELETRLRRLASTDALTGLANRAAFDAALERAMATAHGRDGVTLMLVLIDLDGFKAINDTLGHDAGDEVLRMTGAALSQPWLKGSLAARIGGDEFALIVDDPVLLADPEALRLRIDDALRITVGSGGLTMISGGSVGIAAFDADDRSPRDFVRRTDTNLYTAKRGRVGRRPASPGSRRAA
ncbi:diguanylate cyclase [uncultured Sphingomonas sp.]|uniref:sensor domain-containing diguanylate cyclase n=1 Tax=uncultured Sphingomonas sp. TaxID=158754 RepID=UPI002582E7FE|nr:diguanylate cyclase [uncultured Sphingomonas sp.]